MSIQSKKIEFLSRELNVDIENILVVTSSNQGDYIENQKFLSEFFGVLNDAHLILYQIKSKGLFKKEYSLLPDTHKISYSDFEKAEFGRGGETLWLQTIVSGKTLIFTSNWKLESSKKFINILSEKIEIKDLKLFKK